jgi:hypothetical protein
MPPWVDLYKTLKKKGRQTNKQKSDEITKAAADPRRSGICDQLTMTKSWASAVHRKLADEHEGSGERIAGRR